MEVWALPRDSVSNPQVLGQKSVGAPVGRTSRHHFFGTQIGFGVAQPTCASCARSIEGKICWINNEFARISISGAFQNPRMCPTALIRVAFPTPKPLWLPTGLSKLLRNPFCCHPTAIGQLARPTKWGKGRRCAPCPLAWYPKNSLHPQGLHDVVGVGVLEAVGTGCHGHESGHGERDGDRAPRHRIAQAAERHAHGVV